MKYTVHVSEADAKSQQSRVTKLMGYPSAGRDAKTGAVVEPDNPGAPGWTMRHGNVRKHPSKAEWATAAGAEVSAALVGAKTAEDLETKAAVDAAVDLPADWTEIETKRAKAQVIA